jgi:hypothetical protein
MPEIADVEVAVPYWDSIAKALDCHRATAIKFKAELQTAGVIFYRRNKRNNKRIVYHFPSRLRAWTGIKGSKNEII